MVMAMLCLNFGAMAQEPIKPLKVGDKLPEIFWQQEHTIYANGKTTTETLEQYRDKLLILDFWATWCGSCISKFPLLHSLQREYSNELAIILVNKLKTDSDTNKVKQAFNTHTKKLSLSTLMADEYLGALFPHWKLPHYVWIDRKGSVMGITSSDFINKATIATITNARHKREVKP